MKLPDVRAEGWTDAAAALLVAAWPQRSAAEIGAMLGTAKSAVISKAKRLGLEAKDGTHPTPREVPAVDPERRAAGLYPLRPFHPIAAAALNAPWPEWMREAP